MHSAPPTINNDEMVKSLLLYNCSKFLKASEGRKREL